MFPKVILDLSLKQYTGQALNIDILWRKSLQLPSEDDVRENEMKYPFLFNLLESPRKAAGSFSAQALLSIEIKFLKALWKTRIAS